jgi:exopolyphosphatase/guanosine-5'-triphosphate,3'-diphosphate pyrophosphatase
MSGERPVPHQGDFFGDAVQGFAPPDVRAERIAVIDAGSNSVRLVVFDGQSRAPVTLWNEKVMCGLGARLQETGRLDPEGKARALAALRRYAALVPRLGTRALAAIGTAAIRDAEDGAAFRAEVEAETGIRLVVASGEDEARLAAKGVAFGNPAATGVVLDLGGGSLEFCRIENGEAGQGLSTPLGPLRLQAARVRGSDMDASIRRYLDTLAESYRLDGGRLYLVGGAWRALARAQMARTDYPLRVLHEYRLTPADGLALAQWAMRADPREIAALPGVPSGRVKTIPFAGRLLGHLVRMLVPGEIQISAFGLREGVCLDNLTSELRGADPLLSACREQERRRARAPGFGDELADWAIAGLDIGAGAEARLARAAAILADVNWRTHPDHRTQGCWETVTRTAITDVGHEGRVFLGAALVMRHRSSRKAVETNGATALLAPGERDSAVRLGLALRLGSALSGASPGILRHTRLRRTGGKLRLVLDPPAALFGGEEIEKRLWILAREMALEPELVTEGTTPGG